MRRIKKIVKVITIMLPIMISSCWSYKTTTHDYSINGINYRNFDKYEKLYITDLEIVNNLGYKNPNRIQWMLKYDRPVADVIEEVFFQELAFNKFTVDQKSNTLIRTYINICNLDEGYAIMQFHILDKSDEKLLFDKTYKTVYKRKQSNNLDIPTQLFKDCIEQFLKETNERLIALNIFEPYESPKYVQTAPSVSQQNQNVATKKTSTPSIYSQYSQSEKWAVIVGVSQYKDTRIPSLRYASRDARALYDWMISPQGGRYSPSRVKLLTDQIATSRNIKDALFSWLKQTIDEDMVTIYFAGHGSPESYDSTDNLYILPYDTEYDNIASTAFPMWDIETALKRFVNAKKVVVMVDACHSGGVGQSFDIATRSGRGLSVNPISSRFEALADISDGICVISASSDKQLSQEGPQWGGGHGVFTHFLLQGLKGEADFTGDGRVTLGELISYLSERVRRETQSKQTPSVSGKYDPAMKIRK